MPSTLVAPSHGTHRALHVTLWIVQALLAVAFLVAGAMKLASPLAALAEGMPWVRDVPGGLVRFIGFCEVAGGLGILVPAMARIRPYLTVVAATGLTLLMATAFMFHVMRAEPAALPYPAVLGLLAAFVAWGRRSDHAPIEPRTPRP